MALLAGGGPAQLVRTPGTAGPVQRQLVFGSALAGAKLAAGLPTTFLFQAADGASQMAPSAALYAVIYASALAAPSAAQIKAGQNVNSAAAVWAGSVAAPTSSATFDWPSVATGLSPGTSYRVAFVWSDGVTDSNVAVSDPWTTQIGAAFKPFWARHANVVIGASINA